MGEHMHEAPVVHRDMEQKDEQRKAEIKRLTGEEYHRKFEYVRSLLAQRMELMDAMRGEDKKRRENLKELQEHLIQAAKTGRPVQVTQFWMRNALADSDWATNPFPVQEMDASQIAAVLETYQKEPLSTERDMYNVVMLRVKEFAEAYDLRPIITPGMRAPDILAAINQAYESKMYRLTNRLEATNAHADLFE